MTAGGINSVAQSWALMVSHLYSPYRHRGAAGGGDVPGLLFLLTCAKARLRLINCNNGGLLVDNRGSGPVFPRLLVFFESIINKNT